MLRSFGFEVLPSHANFIFAKTPKMSGEELYNRLKDEGILVRYFSKERISDFVRITIGSKEQMEIFIETVRRIIK